MRGGGGREGHAFGYIRAGGSERGGEDSEMDECCGAAPVVSVLSRGACRPREGMARVWRRAGVGNGDADDAGNGE